jgi:hypothetical protein
MIPLHEVGEEEGKKKMMIAILDESATRCRIEQQWVSLFA